MESKRRRASPLRTNRPHAVPPAETPPGATEPVETAAEELISAKPPAQVVTQAQTALPSVDVGAETTKSASTEDLADFGREAFAALLQSQTAMARGLEALSAELTGLALSGIDAAARTATDLLAIRTLSDAIEINAGFGRSSFDALVGSSAKLSELGAKLAAEASQPIMAQLGKGWIKVARFAF